MNEHKILNLLYIQIFDLNSQLTKDKDRIRTLELENQELSKKINDNKNISNENNINIIKDLEKKNEQLLKELNEIQKKLELYEQNENNSKELDLYKKLYLKDEELNDLKLKISRFPFELLEGEKMISINFISITQDIRCSIICKNNDIFTTVENKLYNIYPDLKKTENYFIFNGNKIEKYSTLLENHISDNSIITLGIIDSDNILNTKDKIKAIKVIFIIHI